MGHKARILLASVALLSAAVSAISFFGGSHLYSQPLPGGRELACLDEALQLGREANDFEMREHDARTRYLYNVDPPKEPGAWLENRNRNQRDMSSYRDLAMMARQKQATAEAKAKDLALERAERLALAHRITTFCIPVLIHLRHPLSRYLPAKGNAAHFRGNFVTPCPAPVYGSRYPVTRVTRFYAYTI